MYRADQDADNVYELFSAPIDASASPTKLNDPYLSNESAGSFKVTPDSAHVVYDLSRYDADSDTIDSRLLSVPIDRSSAPVQLSSGGLGSRVYSFQTAPDSARVVFSVRHLDAAFHPSGLCSVPISGGSPPVSLHPALAAGPTLCDVYEFQFSPDGRHIAYIADQDVDGVRELFAVQHDGLAPPLELTPLEPYSLVFNVRIAPDSARAVFQRSSSAGPSNLFSVLLDGSASPVALHPPLGTDGYAYQFEISPDASRVVYVADQDTNEVFELYSVPIDGSAAPVKLSGPMVAGGRVALFGGIFQIAPDGQRVVYLAEQDTDGVIELYSAPIDGSSAPVKLSGLMVAGGDLSPSAQTLGAPCFRFSPDASRVVYRADQDTDEVFELYSAPLDGSAASVKLNGTMVAGGDVTMAYGLGDFQVSPDGARVVYRADQDADDVFELFSVPIDASASPVKLSGALVAGGDVAAVDSSSFGISPDGSRVVYRADQDVDERFELYGVPIDASASPVKLSGTLVAGGDVVVDYFAGFEIAPDGERVVYLADASTDEHVELWIAPLDGSAGPVKLSGPLGAGDVVRFRLAPDGRQLVYLADQDVVEVFELYRAPLDAGVAPHKLHRALGDERDASWKFQISPDSTRVVYLADQASDEVQELWMSPIARAPRFVESPPERP